MLLIWVLVSRGLLQVWIGVASNLSLSKAHKMWNIAGHSQLVIAFHVRLWNNVEL